jgi:hypothetical protein
MQKHLMQYFLNPVTFYLSVSQPVVRVPLGVRGGPVWGTQKGNGGKHKKKKRTVKIKTQKQSYEVLVYKEGLR